MPLLHQVLLSLHVYLLLLAVLWLCLSTPYDKSWLLTACRSALTAHFGQGLEVSRRGRKMRQWKVAAGLTYGQVKKSERRRKLARGTHVMRLGTQADLTVARASGWASLGD